jgi:hypothetical protein
LGKISVEYEEPSAATQNTMQVNVRSNARLAYSKQKTNHLAGDWLI